MEKPTGERRPTGPAANPETDETRSPGRAVSQPGGWFYEIRLRGHLNAQWSDWLQGLTPTLLANGDTLLCGPVVDQAALMGILNKLNGLNLTLLSVNAVNRRST